MTESDRSRIRKYYTDLVGKYGDDPRACDYGREKSQATKFEILSGPIQSGHSILDVGCGYAAFADYLKSEGFDVSYTGIDICPEMIEQARLRNPELDLHVSDPFEIAGKWDVVTANGIFYLLKESPWASMQNLIKRMFHLSEQVCIFNSLSTWSPRSYEDEYQADPNKVVEFCSSLTTNVVLDHSYMPHDFCITLRHGPQED